MRGVFWAVLVTAMLVVGGMGLRGFAATGHAHAAAPVPKRALQLQRSINQYAAQLAREGKANCCVRPACSYCVIHAGECPCAKHVAANQPVCRECKGGWDAGEGVVPGKTAAEIKVMPAAPLK